MKRFLVSATSAAVLSLLSSGAFAAPVDLNNPTAVNFAQELVTVGVTPLKTGAAADVNVNVKLGFGVAAATKRYIRFDLTNAKFGAAITGADLVGMAAGATVVQGGATTDNYVIFEAEGKVGGNLQTDVLTFNAGTGGYVIQAAGAPVQVAYALYQDAASAVAAGSAGRLANVSAGSVAALASGVKFSAVTNDTTVDVASAPSYSHFLTGGAGTSTTVAQIGKVTLDKATDVFKPDGTATAYGDFVAAGTKLILKGDFSGADLPSGTSKGLYLAGGADCSVAGKASDPDTPVGGAAVFKVDATAQAGVPMCFTVKTANVTQIAQQSFTVEADITPKAGASTADFTPITAGTFTRNGLVLKAAFAETTAVSGVARAVTLVNTSSLPAPYTVRCMVNSATPVAGTPGTLPGTSSTRIQLGSPGLGCPTNGTLRGVEITLATSPSNVIGSVVSQSLSTGAASFDGMTGNK